MGGVTDDGTPLPEGCVFRQAARTDVPFLSELAGIPIEECRRRLARQDECYGVFLDGKPVHLVWLHFGPCYVRGPGLLIEAAPSDCYVYGVITDPAHRRRHLYSRVQRRLIRLLNARGASRLVQVVYRRNEIVLKVLRSLGYQLEARARSTTILSVKRTILHVLASGERRKSVFWRMPAGIPFI
jgi:GNAT superfamily N-acetyltransferase